MKAKSSVKSKANGRGRGLGLDPPQMNMQPTNHRKLRFVNQATSDIHEVIFSGQVLASLGAISTSTTEGFCICSSFKIKKIDIWATPKSDSDGAWQSAFIEWKNSTSFSKSTREQDISNSNARPLHLSSSPPKFSVCDFWVHGPAVELFNLKVPTGAIIDISLDYTIADWNEPIEVPLIAPDVGRMVFVPLSASLNQPDRNV